MKDNDPVWAMGVLLLTVFGCAYESVEELALEQYADWLPVSLLIVCVLLSLVLLLLMWRELRIAERENDACRGNNHALRHHNNTLHESNDMLRNRNRILHGELEMCREINKRSSVAIKKYEEARGPRTPRV